MNATSPLVIVGAGFTGLSLAYDLAQNGHKVLVLESDNEPGGLSGTFEILPGIRIEKFYHHWFTSDLAIINLAKELGLEGALRYIPSRTGLYYANSRFRLSSPWDLLTFKAIPLIDRIRTGLMALKARRISDWKPLESQTAEEWILRHGGKRAYEVVWQPLLRGKFGTEASNVSAVWFWNKLKLRGSSRGKNSKEELVYFEGGFQTLISRLCEAIKFLGGEIRCGVKVQQITSEKDQVTGVKLDNEFISSRTVIATTPLPTFAQLIPQVAVEYRDQLGKIRFLGNVCLILRLKKSLSETYWLNVADPQFPFVGVIEHTNFDDVKNFKGEHIAYISKYLPTNDFLYQATDQQVFEYCLPYIKKIFPEFTPEWVIGYNVWRAAYSQPVITPHYSKLIPQFDTPIRGLWLATMAQVYPEDRGTNYAVQYGRKVAALINKALKSER